MVRPRVFPRDYEVGVRRLQESKMLDLSMNSIRWEKQETLFESFAKVGYAKQEKTLLWDLVGHGHAYVDCGELRAKGCDNVSQHEHGKVFGRVYKRNCGRKACPTCYESWASNQALRGLVRLTTFKFRFGNVDKLISEAHSENEGRSKVTFHTSLVVKLDELVNSGRMKPIHVVFSPNSGIIDDSMNYFLRARRLAYDIARNQGLIGGSMVFHPYRERCVQCHSTIPDWSKSCVKCGCSSFEWFFSPHFHVIGYGWIRNVKEGYDKHGWVVKNLGVRKSVFWTFQYILSHAGVSCVHTTTWFGRLAYNMMRSVPVIGVFHEVCPYCHRPLFPLVWVGGEDRGPPALEYHRKDPLDNEFLADITDWRVLTSHG